MKETTFKNIAITIDPDLSDPSLKHTLTVDQSKLETVVARHRRVNKPLHLVLSADRRWQPHIFDFFDPLIDTTVMSVERYERIYERYQEQAGTILAKRKTSKATFDRLLTTKRLEEYLATAPVERARPFAEKILKQAVSRKANDELLHQLYLHSHPVGDQFYNSLALRTILFLAPFLTCEVAIAFLSTNPNAHLITALMAPIFSQALLQQFDQVDLYQLEAQKFVQRFKQKSDYRDLIQFI